MSAPDFVRLLNGRQYATAKLEVERLLHEDFTAAARAVVAWKGIFADRLEALGAVPFFQWVYDRFSELAGADSPAAMAAAENLASMLGSVDRLDEAIALREKVYGQVRSRFAPDDPRFIHVGEGLALLYREAGQDSRAATLYDDSALCEHLAPAVRFLRESGVSLASLCQPWSRNCHLWAYYEVILDCERLIAELQLAPCVRIHDHRGTHDGSERGLVCDLHNDAVMGRHPALTSSSCA